MRDLIKQLIVDFQQQEIPRPTPRHLQSMEVPEGVRKAIVLVGMRRSGKTWTLYERMRQLEDSGLPRRKILYINFEDDRLAGLQLEDLSRLVDLYFELYPDLIGERGLHFFFDEIHEVPGWEKFIRRLLDTEQVQLYITGSSAKLLSTEIATSLRGRTLVREIFPFSFSEYLDHLNIMVHTPPTSREIAVVQHHLQRYLEFGGFPEVVRVEEPLHREILQSYMDTVIYRDIIDRYEISNPHPLKRLLIHCLQNASSPLSIHKTYQTLKSQGHSVSKGSLYAFMDHLQDAYCIFSVPSFTLSAKKRELVPKKVYPVDPGLISAYAIDRSYARGATLEGAVFVHLLRRGGSLYYYMTSGGREVDFFHLANGCKTLIQVSLSLQNEKTRRRELEALQEAMGELEVEKGWIVTLNEDELIETPEGKIVSLPIWKFLL